MASFSQGSWWWYFGASLSYQAVDSFVKGTQFSLTWRCPLSVVMTSSLAWIGWSPMRPWHTIGYTSGWSLSTGQRWSSYKVFCPGQMSVKCWLGSTGSSHQVRGTRASSGIISENCSGQPASMASHHSQSWLNLLVCLWTPRDCLRWEIMIMPYHCC